MLPLMSDFTGANAVELSVSVQQRHSTGEGVSEKLEHCQIARLCVVVTTRTVSNGEQRETHSGVCNVPKNGTTARQDSKNSAVGMPSLSVKTISSNLQLKIVHVHVYTHVATVYTCI